jgi:bifunctional UDP-N-acetylglucosamine pyrophosphorylase / glucosamine-1-phosphate N-acetyltransferase
MKAQKKTDPKIAIVIMAAGKGTRLKSRHPKVLHEVGGKPLLAHVIAAATRVVAPSDVFTVIGHEADRVREAVKDSGVNFVLQQPQRGTGHALMVAGDCLNGYHNVLVLSGDAPLITPETVKQLRDFHLGKKAAMTILTALLPDPAGYGRVLRIGRGDEVQAIVEQKSANPKQQKVKEINSGFYAFQVPALQKHIQKLSTDNAHAEFYLTDMAAILRQAKEKVVAVTCQNPSEILGGNTRAELADIDLHMRAAKCRQLMAAGVTIFNPQSCVIDTDVEIGPDTVIEPHVQLRGKTRVGSDCHIESYCVIHDSEIGDEVLLHPGCVIESSRIALRAIMGPYCHLRPASDIGEGARIGNFVETKKMKIGKGSKANHLTYLGDSEIGAGVNIGAGTITCNYDGSAKYRTVIEDGVFVGSDTTLVAPIRLGKGSYVAAASCLTEDVPADALALGRARQAIKENWAKHKREKT